MNFVSVEFWILVLLTVIGCNICKSKEHKRVILFLTSCAFYGWWDVRFLGMVLAYTCITYFMTCKMGSGNKVMCGMHIVFSLLLLGGFKYYNFFIESINDIAGTRIRTLDIILPLGISFYILTAIGYVLDVYMGKYDAEKNFWKVAMFIMYYPKMLSGPIERGQRFFDKLDSIERITKERFHIGIQIIAFGLLKKLVIADRLGVCVDAVFAAPEIYNAPAILCAMISYAIQIYCDFSGYTDIAIGVSYLIGIQLDENFNLPYCATNPSDFWKRWHISLSGWFRDYAYIPMGGSRKGSICTYRNILLTMLVSGIWHGANWTFVLWGFIHGVAQCLHRLWKKRIAVSNWLMMAVNFTFVTIAWTIFRADSLSVAGDIFLGVLTWQGGIQYIYVFTPIYFLLVMLWEWNSYSRNNGNTKYPMLDLDKPVHLGLFTAELLLILGLAYFGNGAFIYNQF